MKIINKITNRIPKTWQPKTNEGLLCILHFDVDSIDMKTGDWLVLSRTRHMLNDIEESLYSTRVVLRKIDTKEMMNKIYMNAATAWESGLKGQSTILQTSRKAYLNT